MKTLLVVCLLGVISPVLLPADPSQAGAASRPDDAADLQKLTGIFGFIQRRNAKDYAIDTTRGMDEGRYVELGGLQQWITIRGEDRTNPVLLFLHGGPGDATNPWSYTCFRPWLKAFTVVQWDQRGTGRTLGRNGPSSAATITVERMVQDGVELADHLRKALGKDKVVLVGHSWGSILGVLMAKARPDLFSVFVGTGQVADAPAKAYVVAYEELLAAAERRGEHRALRELEEIGPPPYKDGAGFAVQRRWSNLLEGADTFIHSMIGSALTAPGYSMRDVNDWLDGQGLSAARLVPQTRAIDAARLGGSFAVPVIVIQGAEDFTTPTRLARGFVDSIQAPSKAFVPLEGGGHFAVFIQGDAFLNELVARVLPLTKGR